MPWRGLLVAQVLYGVSGFTLVSVVGTTAEGITAIVASMAAATVFVVRSLRASTEERMRLREKVSSTEIHAKNAVDFLQASVRSIDDKIVSQSERIARLEERVIAFQEVCRSRRDEGMCDGVRI